MKIISIIITSLFLFENVLASSYLERYRMDYPMNFTVFYNRNVSVKFNLVEIFNPFEQFYYLNGKSYTLHNQLNLVYANDGKQNNFILRPSFHPVDVWIRVIEVFNLVPGGITLNPDITTTSDLWSTTLMAIPASVIIGGRAQCCIDIKYSIHAIPLYPAGNAQTWSSEYENFRKNRSLILINAINSSVEEEYLQKNGDLLYSTTFGSGSISFTVASRKIRDYLLIIMAHAPNNTVIQYPPVYIKGCLSMDGYATSCKLFPIKYPMYIILGLAIVFFIFASKYDLVQVLFCGWISTGVITLLIWQIIERGGKFYGSTLYVVFLGMAPAFAVMSTLLICFTTRKYNRIRIFFTSFVLTVIFLSVMWFTPLRSYKQNNLMLFIIVSVVVASVLFVMLALFNHLTMIVGGAFISAVLISLSLSINNMNASIIPFIFIDFYNSILYASPNWIYYSPMLIDDLIIVILSPLLSIIVGLTFYSFFKRSLIQKKKRERERYQRTDEHIGLELNRTDLNISSPVVEQNIVIVCSDSPPSYLQVQPPANTQPIDPPPSYDVCVKLPVEPSAPVNFAYNGPYAERF